jgi:hypothetical protein
MIGRFLLWLQERIKHWTKPATPVLIIGILSDQTRNRTDLIVEIALLRQQLIVLNRQIKHLSQPTLTVFASFFFSILRSSGNDRFIARLQVATKFFHHRAHGEH